MIENIYICRHGHRADFHDAADTVSPTGMFQDPRLSPEGLEQADAVGGYLSNPPKPLPVPELIFSSPYYRCLQTARPLAMALNKEIHLEHGIQEWFSKAAPGTGLHSRPYTAKELQQHFPDTMLHPTYTATYFANREGESLQELQDRVETFMEAFVCRVEAEYPDVRTVVLFSHAALVIALGRALLGNNDHDVRSPTAGVSFYRRKGLPALPGLEPITALAKPDKYGALDAAAAKYRAHHPELDAIDATREADREERATNGSALAAEAARLNGDPQVALSAKRAEERGEAPETQYEPVLGMWDQLVNAHVDHLPGGRDRDWDFSKVRIENGDIVLDRGSGEAFTAEDNKHGLVGKWHKLVHESRRNKLV